MGKGFGTVALIFGSFCIPVSGAMAALGSMGSLLIFWAIPPALTALISVIGWLIPTIAIIFGIIGIVRDDSKGRAITGFILGVVGLVVGIVIRLLIENFFATLIP